MCGVDRRRAGTHSADHQSDKQLMRVIDWREHKRAAAPQNTGDEGPGDCKVRPATVLRRFDLTAPMDIPKDETEGGQTNHQRNPGKDPRPRYDGIITNPSRTLLNTLTDNVSGRCT